MNNYRVGYGCPPDASKFKPGQSGNLKGRPRRVPKSAHDILEDVFGRYVPKHISGGGKARTVEDLRISIAVNRALQGDINAAEAVLELRKHADRFTDPVAEEIQIIDTLPTLAKQAPTRPEAIRR